MKTRDLLLIAAAAFVLYLLSRRSSSTSPGVTPSDPWSQRIDSGTSAVKELWNIGTSLFGGGSSSGTTPPTPTPTDPTAGDFYLD